MTNNETWYYVAIGTDNRVIAISDYGESYYSFFKKVREELRYGESHIGVREIKEITVPSQS